MILIAMLAEYIHDMVTFYKSEKHSSSQFVKNTCGHCVF